jgi:hypothetical protein
VTIQPEPTMADDDDYSPTTPAPEPASPRGFWSALSRWWTAPATPADAALGYESAQPWTLEDATAQEPGEPDDPPRRQ